MAQAAREEIGAVLERTIEDYTAQDYAEDWDLEGLMLALNQIYPVNVPADQIDRQHSDTAELVDLVLADAGAQYEAREAELGEEVMRALERFLLLQVIDERWREHLYDMDYLREGIGLRGAAQLDPLVAYKNEAYTLFTDLMNTVWSDFTRMIFHVEFQAAPPSGAAGALPGCRQLDPRGERHLLGRRSGRRARDRRRCGRCSSRERACGGRVRRARGGSLDGCRRAASPQRGRANRAQRPVLVRVGQEVQALSRSVGDVECSDR